MVEIEARWIRFRENFSMIHRPRIVVAGQIPPPMGGQNAMVLELLEKLRHRKEIRVDHLAFRFTQDTQAARKGQFGKVVELVRVIGRLIRLRLAGPIDVLVFPPGGPQRVPLFRDLLLLPWILLLCRRTVLHFHAAGIADAVRSGDLLARLVAWLCGRCHEAVVMTEFNRRDPVACGISVIHTMPHALRDDFSETNVERNRGETRLLAMGHLCEDKGTVTLIKAVAALRKDFPNLVLELAGESLAPYSAERLNADLDQAGIRDRVRVLGMLSGDAKKQAFARADLFVFPSVAPYESFGLVMVEAMMWGLPIIASEWRGNADVLGDSPGSSTFAPPGSDESLQNCLRAILARPENWSAMGKANREVFLARYHDTETRRTLPDLLIDMAYSRNEASK
jgi:glycosyltransferase involved in cell wall biosynthesis